MKKIVPMILIAVLLYTAIAVAYDTPDIVDYSIYVVSYGDTLWDIAKMSNGYGQMDTRDIIYDIKSASNCTSDIQIGDELLIPVYRILHHNSGQKNVCNLQIKLPF